MKQLLGVTVVLLALTLTAAARNGGVEASSQPFRGDMTGSPGIEGVGCWLNFKASNTGSRSILIDISRSRIKLYGAVGWNRIKNTSNRNVGARSTANFTVWAKTCGGTTKHQVRFYLKRSDGNTRTIQRMHYGKFKVTDLGDLNRFF